MKAGLDRPMAVDRPHEFELIKTFFAPLAGDPGSLGLTDDAAVLTPRKGHDLVLTKDVLAADVHFFAADPPEAIAAKALRVNLSDLAAKGAQPRGYLLGLALPDAWEMDWLRRFCQGLEKDQDTYAVQLLGGDTISANGGLQVSVTAIGEVPTGCAVRRTGALPGDFVYVTGTIGDGAAGLKERMDPIWAATLGLSSEHIAHIRDRYLLPLPRTMIAATLVRHASAAMDISDGLFADAGHLARASQTGLSIDLEKIPLSPALRQIAGENRETMLSCLNGGDDYEILAAVPASKTDEFESECDQLGAPATLIGEVNSDAGTVKILEGGIVVPFEPAGGFRHF